MSHDETVHSSGNDRRRADGASRPDPEVVPQAERRRFTAEYKLRVLTEADACTKPGEIGALLRREGLYRSHLDKWRTARQAGTLHALTPSRRGPQADPLAAEIAQLQRANARLQQRCSRPKRSSRSKKTLRAAWSSDERERRAMLIHAAEELAATHGVAAACAALAVPRSSFYRVRAAARGTAPLPPECEPDVRPTHPRALRPTERTQVRDLLNSAPFQDLAPREIYAELLDAGRYLCSIRTMYRILAADDEVRERRNQRRHPIYEKPELLATGPNQVWSWDITKLRGPSKGVYYYLYVTIDIYSRYVVGWLVAEVESGELAEQLIAETCTKQGVARAQLTLHADNGSPMIAKNVAILLADLGVAKSHSRPHVSNDNPYSEAQFRTLKYRPDYPDRFGSLADARSWSRTFFHWYNNQHHHTGLGLLTPADVHTGRAEMVRQQRQVVLTQAFQTHPERFVQGAPHSPELPAAAWINPPKSAPVAPPAAGQPTDTRAPTTTSSSAAAIAPSGNMRYTAASGTEDRATLRSDLSAAPVDGVAGQSRTAISAALPTTPPIKELHSP